MYHLAGLDPGVVLDGPAIIMQNTATVVVEPGCRATVTADGSLEIEVLDSADRVFSEELDPIYLSIFSHRFMGIAEQVT